MYRLLEWAFAYDDGSGLPDAGAYAAELKNVTATADGKPVQGFDPTKTGTWTIPAGTQVNIVDMPDDWKLDGKAEQPAGTVVFTASKYGTPVVTWTFKNDSATDPDKPADPGTDALKNVAATADGKPIAGFDPTRDGAYKVAAGAKVRISDVPSDWKLDKTESGSKLVFTASKGGTAVTWTFEYQANGGSSATDPGNGGGMYFVKSVFRVRGGDVFLDSLTGRRTSSWRSTAGSSATEPWTCTSNTNAAPPT